MTEENKEQVEEFEIIEQTGTADAAAPAKEEAAPHVEDERLRNDEDDDEDEGSSASEGETPEQRAERRREERRKRRDRQRKAEAENKAELQRLREHNEYISAKMQQMEAMRLRDEAEKLDQRMLYAKNTYERAERAHAEAIARGDGMAASQALRIRDQAGAEYRDSEAVRNRLVEIGNQREAPQRPQGPDPRVVSKAKAFIEKHSWIDPNGMKDEDSAVAQALDKKLQADGYDPTTDEYWDVLEKTLEKRLPHRFQKQTGRSGPPVTGGMDRSASGKKTFVISPDRKKAMIDAGIWDDPVQRNKMIKRYADYDAQQKSATR